MHGRGSKVTVVVIAGVFVKVESIRSRFAKWIFLDVGSDARKCGTDPIRSSRCHRADSSTQGVALVLRSLAPSSRRPCPCELSTRRAQNGAGSATQSDGPSAARGSVERTRIVGEVYHAPCKVATRQGEARAQRASKLSRFGGWLARMSSGAARIEGMRYCTTLSTTPPCGGIGRKPPRVRSASWQGSFSC